jgi:hypothetical protein
MDTQTTDSMDADVLQALYAKTIYTLRESAKELPKQHSVESVAALLEKIRCGELPEHPAYENYLSARIIDQMKLQVRVQASEQLYGTTISDAKSISVHLLLKNQIEERYAQRVAEPMRLPQDALLLSLGNGLMIEARYFSTDEYSVGWCWGEAEVRIDTAPLHVDLATFPHHLHGDDSPVAVDPASCPDDDFWVNFPRLIDMFLVNPLLD